MERPPEELVFIVRMWRAGAPGDGARWRGYVSEVRSGSRFYISDPRDVADFIAARAADPRELR